MEQDVNNEDGVNEEDEPIDPELADRQERIEYFWRAILLLLILIIVVGIALKKN